MSSIDQRIVEMQFDNQQFEKGIQTSLKSLTSLKQSLRLDRAKDGIDETAESVKNLAHQFTLFGRIALKVKDTIADLVVNRGKQLVKSLSIDQVSSGWTKYGQKTTSVQAIMNATGKSIDEVNGYLDKLMWFSDETSYSFTEMTSALGTMTSSGGDINKLIPMIEGMAAATSFAGKGAAEFSRVIYNLNQSYGQGYLSFLDWKSVEGANVNSEQLKQTLIDTAVALGTLKKDSKGVIRTAKNTIVTVANMGSTLNEKWATKEVMEQAFGQFGAVFQDAYELVQSGQFDTAADAIASLAGKYDDVYYNATKAAQEAKTFTEAIDSTKDAVSSGWMESFEIIFGNYEEAKEMWTDLTNFLWDAFASGAKNRNKLLEEWKELGGRDDLIEGVGNSLRAILNIVTALKGGIAEIFPSPDATQLVALTKKVKEFGDMLLRLSGEEYSETEVEVPVKVNPDPEALKRTLKRDMAGDDVKALQERLTSLGYSITDFELGRGYFGVATRDALKQFQKDLGLAADGVYNEDVHEVLWNKLFPPTETTRVEKTVERVSVFSSALERLKRVARGVAAAADILWKGIKFVGTVAFSVLKVLAPLADALLTILAAIGDCFVALDKGLGVSELFSGVLATIIGWLEPVAKGVRKASDALLDFFGLGKKENGTNKSLMTFSKLWGNIKGKLKDWGVWDALTRAWNRLSEAAGKLGNAFKRLWASIKVAWQNLKAAIGEKFPTLFEKTKTGAANLWSKSITAIGIGLSKALDFITSVIHKLPAIGAKIGEFAKSAWEFLTDLWSKLAISEKFKNIAAKVSNFFRSIWEAVSSFFTGSGNKSAEETTEKGLSFFSRIAQVFKNIWTKLTQIVGAIANGISQFYKDVGGIKGLLRKAAHYLGLFWLVIKLIAGIKKVLDIMHTVSDITAVFKTKAKAEMFEALSKVFLNIAIAIGTIVAAIAILGYMDPDALKRGAIALGGILVGLLLLQGAFALLSKFSKGGNGGFEAIQSLAIGILILVGVMNIVARMNPRTYVMGLMGLIGMIVALRLAMVGLKKLDNVKTSIPGIIGLAAGLLLLTFAMKRLGSMSWDELIKGLIGLAGILIALRIFLGVIKNSLDGEMKLKGLIGMAVAMLLLTRSLKTIGQMNFGQMIQGVMGLIGIAAAMRIMAKSAGDINWVSIVGLLANYAGIALLMRVYADTLNRIKDVNPKLVLNLGLSLSALFLSFSFIMRSAKGLSFSGLLKAFLGVIAIAAAIGLVIAAFAGLRKIPGFQDFMNSGAASIGEIVGSFLGGMNKAQIEAFNDIASDMDEKALDRALSLSNSLSEFSKKLPTTGGGNILSLIQKSPLGQFSGDMSTFGTKFTEFANALNKLTPEQYEDLNGKATKAIDIATALATFTSTYVPVAEEKSFSSGIWTWLNGSDLEVFSEGMASFGPNFNTFAGALDQIDLIKYSKLREKADKAIEIATAFATFVNNEITAPETVNVGWLGTDFITATSAFSTDMSTFGEKFSNFACFINGINTENYDQLKTKADNAIQIASAFATFVDNSIAEPATVNLGWFGSVTTTAATAFSGDIKEFGNAFNTFAQKILPITTDDMSELSTKTDNAIKIATALADFMSTTIAEPKTVGTGIMGLDFVTINSLFNKDLADFGGAFNGFATALAGITDPPTEEQVATAVACASTVASFFDSVGKMDGIESKGAIKAWWEGDTNINVVLAGIVTFAKNIVDAANTLSGISEFPTVEGDFKLAMDVLERLVGMMMLLCAGDPNNVTADRQGNYSLFTYLTETLDYCILNITTVADKIKQFYEKTKDLDLTLVIGVMNALTGMFTSMQQLDTKKWTDGLDTDAFVADIESFTTAASNVLDSLYHELNYYVPVLSTVCENLITPITDLQTGFADAGIDMASGFVRNYEWNAGTEPFTESTQLQLNAVTAFKSRFRVAGQDFAIGLAKGLNDRRQYVIKAAKVLAEGVLEKVREVFDEHSPSKEANEIGRYFDKGLVDGFRDGGSETTRAAKEMALDALHGVKDTLLALSTLIADGVDVDPVIRPVVDLSGVTAGAQAIGGMLGGSQTIPVDTSARLAGSAARAAAASAAARRGTEAHARPSAPQPAGDQVNVTGNTFVIRDEQDIYSLASEIASLMYRQQRSVGAY